MNSTETQVKDDGGLGAMKMEEIGKEITREPERVEVERDREGGREEQGREERRD